MGRNTLTERVTRVEERQARLLQDFNKQLENCKETHDRVDKRLDVINREQGETRDAVNELKGLINQKVSAPISGRDRAVLYGTAITAICTAAGLIAQAYFTYLGSLG